MNIDKVKLRTKADQTRFCEVYHVRALKGVPTDPDYYDFAEEKIYWNGLCGRATCDVSHETTLAAFENSPEHQALKDLAFEDLFVQVNDQVKVWLEILGPNKGPSTTNVKG